MDCNTGRIYEDSLIQQLISDGAITDKKRFKQMSVPPTPVQLKNRRVKRNDPCPCGSGEKFKKCCLRDQSDDRF